MNKTIPVLFQQFNHIQKGIRLGVEQFFRLFVRLIQIRDHDGKAACPVGGENAGGGILQGQTFLRLQSQFLCTQKIDVRSGLAVGDAVAAAQFPEPVQSKLPP